jgi:hypothetical protein
MGRGDVVRGLLGLIPGKWGECADDDLGNIPDIASFDGNRSPKEEISMG